MEGILEMNMQPKREGQQSLAYHDERSNPETATSLLVADCGSVFTKVSLFGLVEGQYRLMARGEAPTTITPPQEDISEGVIQAINVIEFITGRHFVADGRIISPEREDGEGVDVFIASISAGGPLRLAILGAVSEKLEKLTAQAISGLYADMVPVPSPVYTA